MISLFIALLSATQSLTGQQVDPPTKPGQCASWVGTELDGKRKALIAALGNEKGSALGWDSTAVWEGQLYRECAARFSIAKIDKQELLPLAEVFLKAKLWDSALTAVQRARKVLTGAQRADAMVAMLAVYLDGSRDVIEWRAVHPSAERVAAAEKVMKEIEKLGPEFTKHKIDGYERISRAYYEDKVDLVQRHLEKAIRLLNTIPEAKLASDTALLRIAPSVHWELAKTHLYEINPDAAIKALDLGIALLAKAPQAAARLTENRSLLAMIGQPAPAVTATNWFNREAIAPAGISFTGKVTLVEFTSHWCGPCRASYPSLVKFHEKYAREGLQVVIHTQLYGFFKDQEKIGGSEEVNADRKYFVTEHGMEFPIGVDTTSISDSSDPDRSPERATPQSSKDYQVRGIPHLVLIDKMGIVRQIYVGWLAPNERSFFDTNFERVDAMIAKLLAEEGK